MLPSTLEGALGRRMPEAIAVVAEEYELSVPIDELVVAFLERQIERVRVTDAVTIPSRERAGFVSPSGLSGLIRSETHKARRGLTDGPRQTGHYGMVIPRFVRQAVRSEPITVYGDGRQTRCFCYVGDVVDVLIELITHPEAEGRVFNIGGTEEISIEELAHRVIELADSDSKIRYVPYDEAYEEGFEDMERRVPDTSRAHNLVGFAPSVPLDQIISRVIEDQLA
jgi:hypothetical protein